MARALLVGCGCHARGAGAVLVDRGWAVRGTSRSEGGRAAIAAAGLEAADADPGLVGTIVEQLGDVTVLAWLFGAIGGEAGAVLNGPRLESLLQKLVDTPVRGFVFERPADGAGVELVEDAIARWHLPARVISGERPGGGGDGAAWQRELADAVEATVGLGGS